MGDWLASAACKGHPEWMMPAYPQYDEQVAVETCRGCPVKVECITESSQGWRNLLGAGSEAPACVVGGITHSTGRRKKVVRVKRPPRICESCGKTMLHLDRDSDTVVCDSCRHAGLADVLEMRRIVQLVLEKEQAG